MSCGGIQSSNRTAVLPLQKTASCQFLAVGEDEASKLDYNPFIGGHVAFQVQDLDAVIARLKAAEIPYSLMETFAIPNMRHLYVYDPGGNLIEINKLVK